MTRSPATFRSRQQFVSTPFGRIAYYEQGQGPAALFVHGVPLNGYQWSGVIDGVDEVRRCLAPDLMGFGATEVGASQDISLEAQADMLAEFLGALGADRADLCGNNSGGAISQIFATKYPGRVRSLTLTNCEVHDRWPNFRAWLFFLSVRFGLIGRQLKQALRDVSLARKRLKPFFEHAEAITAAEIETYFAPLVASDERAALFRKIGRWRRNRMQLVAVAPQQRSSDIPAQVVWGDADEAFDATASLDWLQSNLGGLRRVTMVKDAKLFFMTERPEELIRPLLSFWEQIDAAGEGAHAEQAMTLPGKRE